MEGRTQKCVERYCELAHKTIGQHHEVSSLGLDDHQKKSRTSGNWLSEFIEMLVVGKNWKTRSTLYSQLLGTHNQRQKVLSRWKSNNKLYVNWDYSKTPLLQELSQTQKSTSGGVLCLLGSQTFVPISCTCEKQTAVAYNSTEAEIMSLDAELRRALQQCICGPQS